MSDEIKEADDPSLRPIVEGELPPPPETPPEMTHADGWRPDLNPTQQKIFDDPARCILAFGEKASGKSIGCLHALIRHCYEEDDALAFIISPALRTGAMGVMNELTWALDIWRNGNWKNEKDGTRQDGGMGLEYTPTTLDPQTKDRVLYIGNIYGGWSKVVLVSIPYADVVQKRMKALSPSLVYVDEITELSGREFFTYVFAQLGRRRKIRGPQQFIASCNPEGPSHWVYKVFIEEPTNSETGERDKDFSVYHVPIVENKHHLPPGYIETLAKTFRDPTDFKRLMEGQWIDRASGDSIFKNWWRPEFHIHPPPGSDLARGGHRLVPLQGFPIIMGWDPGPVNFCVSFMQCIPIKKGNQNIWIQFDEMNYVGKYKPDYLIVPEVVRKMDFWVKYLKGQDKFIHISDEAAFSHVRQDGSYDALRIQRLSGGRIKMRACPGHKESRPGRVKYLISLLGTEEFRLSITCSKTKEAIELLQSEKIKEGHADAEAGLRPKRSPYLHPFDATTYPPYYFALNPNAMIIRTENTSAAEDVVFRAGRG